jgi:hypothetical protein
VYAVPTFAAPTSSPPARHLQRQHSEGRPREGQLEQRPLEPARHDRSTNPPERPRIGVFPHPVRAGVPCRGHREAEA